MLLFDGIGFASGLENDLKLAVAKLRAQNQIVPSIHTLVFKEDQAGVIYTRLKAEASVRVGLQYTKHKYSLKETKNTIIEHIKTISKNPACTAILVQKPRRSLWARITGQSASDYDQWWQALVGAIDLAKDVDGLHPQRRAQHYQVSAGQVPIWPATAKAVWLILNFASQKLNRSLTREKVAIIGVSELLGVPLTALLQQNKIQTSLITHHHLDELISTGQALKAYTSVISATGSPGLIQGQMLAPDSILIDVGEPRPDFDFASVQAQAAFLTPVPGGVGPVTVMCLLQNAVDMLYYTPS